MSVYERTWPQLRKGWARPGGSIGRVSEVIAHTEAGADLPATATVAQEVQRFRAIDAYHRSLGWAGFGYSAMVCQSGRIYEGRGYGRSGAHTVGRNTTALAFVVPGHGDRTPMSDACIDAARRWIAAGIAGGHIASRPKVSGHRDYAAKSCPGNRIYPQLGRLVGITSAPAPAPPPDPEPEPETTVVLTRIDNGARVYQVCGNQLVALTSAKQAEHIAKLAGWSGKWQDRVGNLTGKQVRDAGFVLVAPG